MKVALQHTSDEKENITGVDIMMIPDDEKEEEELRNLLRNVGNGKIIMIAAGPDTSIVVQGKDVSVDY